MNRNESDLGPETKNFGEKCGETSETQIRTTGREFTSQIFPLCLLRHGALLDALINGYEISKEFQIKRPLL